MIDNYKLGSSENIGGPESIIQRSRYNSNMSPIMILNDNKLVGCLCLHIKDGPVTYGGNFDTDILLRAFSVDRRCRRKGYAKAALLELPSFVRENFQNIQRLVLAVNHSNIAAQRLYERVGFTDSGKRIMGKLGEIYIYYEVI
ncbi:hypothetical protein ABM34_06815 [Companilactobacillus ginsenosidimutans]|uniref:N-acetyltransferase domain-containing protein n=2 Tax=Companilactobacillus ginsenosidimutans TaxID=1007676 RepID=A0A0H4QKI5_9LACO|nr:hypothetical protein ABM34_06815 [Companilactobacillus ginsenosidimutans]